MSARPASVDENVRNQFLTHHQQISSPILVWLRCNLLASLFFKMPTLVFAYSAKVIDIRKMTVQKPNCSKKKEFLSKFIHKKDQYKILLALDNGNVHPPVFLCLWDYLPFIRMKNFPRTFLLKSKHGIFAFSKSTTVLHSLKKKWTWIYNNHSSPFELPKNYQ